MKDLMEMITKSVAGTSRIIKLIHLIETIELPETADREVAK